MNLADLPPAARLYLQPTGFGSGQRLAGGLVRFSAVEVSARRGSSVDVAATCAVDALGAVADALCPALRTRFEALFAALVAPRPALALGDAQLDFTAPTVMGILNVTPDSFSDGGRHATPAEAADAARAMLAAGAALIDIGGESTRPGAAEVGMSAEIARVGPVLDRTQGLPRSIDTRRAIVMARAIDAGAGLVNDVSALTFDPDALALVARAGVPVVLMHAQGTPQSMQAAPYYDDCLRDVFDWLEARIDACVAGGIARDKIIVDPGIGFGKSLSDNLALINGLALFHGLGCPIMLGASRKRMIGALSNEAPVGERLGGSLALAMAGVAAGAQLLRVHDVADTVQAVRVWRGLRDRALVGR
jgi:dihydropteroate synthase